MKQLLKRLLHLHRWRGVDWAALGIRRWRCLGCGKEHIDDYDRVPGPFTRPADNRVQR